MIELESFHDEGEATRSQLRSFGLIVGAVWAIFGIWPALFRSENPRLWALAVAFGLVAPALIHPQSLRVPYRVWMTVGNALGKVNAKILLSTMFFLVFAPIGKIMRILNRDPMGLRFDPLASTYCVKRERREPAHIKHQF